MSKKIRGGYIGDVFNLTYFVHLTDFKSKQDAIDYILNKNPKVKLEEIKEKTLRYTFGYDEDNYRHYTYVDYAEPKKGSFKALTYPNHEFHYQ